MRKLCHDIAGQCDRECPDRHIEMTMSVFRSYDEESLIQMAIKGDLARVELNRRRSIEIIDQDRKSLEAQSEISNSIEFGKDLDAKLDASMRASTAGEGTR